MKKFKKIMAVLVAAMMIMATCVPAFADTTSSTDSAGATYYYGRLETDHGTITVANAKDGETYTAYKLFDLASFKDYDTANGEHDGEEDKGTATEWYSYVIRETLDGGATPNPWWTFLTTASYGPYVGATHVAYAVPENPGNSTALFVYSNETVKLKGKDNVERTYRIIKANPSYINFNNGEDDTSSKPSRADDPGTKVGTDYVLDQYNSIVQNFAQEAAKFATKDGSPIASLTNAQKDECDIYSHLASTTAADDTATPKRYNASNHTLKLIRQDADTELHTGEDDDAALGYYLITTSMGTLASLDTTNSDVNVYDKNDEPALEKKVLKKNQPAFAGDGDVNKNAKAGDNNENASTYVDSENWVSNTDADIMDYVQFRTVITAEQGMKNYKLHDVMEVGLSFYGDYEYSAEHKLGYKVVLERDKVVDVSVGDSTQPATKTDYYEIPEKVTAKIGGVDYTNVYNYELKKGDAVSDGCDFEILFKDAVEDNTTDDHIDQVNFIAKTSASSYEFIDVKDGDRIVVYYYAQLTADAAIFGSVETATGADTAITDTRGNTLGSALQVKRTHANDNQRNDNFTILTYGDRSSTPELCKASVTTYQFDVVKTGSDKNPADGTKPNKLLAGAKFNLYKVVLSTDTTAASPNGVYDNSKTTGQEGYYITKELDGKTYCVLNTAGTALADGKAMVFSSSSQYLYSGDATTTASTGQTIELVSKDNEAISIRGLEAGYYLLEETLAPLGYDKLAHPILIKIWPDANSNGGWEDDKALYTADDAEVTAGTAEVGDVKVDNEGRISRTIVKNNGTKEIDKQGKLYKADIVSDVVDTVTYYYYVANSAKTLQTQSMVPDGKTSSDTFFGLQVVNTTGEELPSTGGMGTTVLYIVGGMMVILAGAYLFFSRRRQA